MSDAMENWKPERGRTSVVQNRAREDNVDVAQPKVVQNETRSPLSGEGEATQCETVQLSMALDMFSKQVQEKQKIIEGKKKERDELAKMCARQAENILECSQATIQTSTTLANDVHLREAFMSKYNKAFQMFRKIYCNSKCVTDSLHKVEAVREKLGPHISEVKTKADKMNKFLEDIILVTLPSLQQRSSLMKYEAQKNLDDDAVGAHNTMTSLRQQLNNEKAPKIDQDSKEKKCIQDLSSKIQEEKNLAEELFRQSETNYDDKNKQIQILQRKLEAVLDTLKTVDNDLTSIQRELKENQLHADSLQNKLSDAEERKFQLQSVIELNAKETNDITELTSNIKAAQMDSESQLNSSKEYYSVLNAKIEQLREQLLEEENKSAYQVKVLTEEVLKAEKAFDKIKRALQEALEEAKLKDSEILSEESDLERNLVEFQNELETFTTNNSKIAQFNSSLGDEMTVTNSELQHLAQEVEKNRIMINNEKCSAQLLEDTLKTNKENLKKLLTEFHDNLTQLIQEENDAVRELAAVETSEKELESKIQMLQTNIEKEHLLTTKQHNLQLKESEEKMLNLQEEIATEIEQKEVVIMTLKQKLSQLSQNHMTADDLITNLQSDVSTKDQNLKNIEIKTKQKMQARKEKEAVIEKYKHEILKCEEILKENDLKEKLMITKSQELDSYLNSVDHNIAQVLLAQKEKEANILSLKEDHEKKKQILLQDLLQYRSTSECCTDEIEVWKKQSISWNEKISAIQSELEKVKEGNAAVSAKVQQSNLEVGEVNKQIQDILKRKGILKKETKQIEEETAEVMKKYNRIKTKVDAHIAKVEQKKKQVAVLNSNKDIAHITAAQNMVTPQLAVNTGAGEGSAKKDETPKSILKTPTISPSQSTKRVKFRDDVVHSPSAASTVIMGSEPETNPQNGTNILDKYFEQQRSDKLCKTSNTLEINEGTQRAEKRKSDAGPSPFNTPSQTAPQRLFLEAKRTCEENRHGVACDDDDDKRSTSSLSSIHLDDYKDEIKKDPLFIRRLMAGEKPPKTMKMIYPPSASIIKEPSTPKHAHRANETSEAGPSPFKTPSQTAPQRPHLQAKKSYEEHGHGVAYDVDDDDRSSTSSLSSIHLDDYKDEMKKDPLFIRRLMAGEIPPKRMKMNHPPSAGKVKEPSTPKHSHGVNEISSSTPESEYDWLK